MMGEWDNYCGEIGEVCKDLETQAVRIAELESAIRPVAGTAGRITRPTPHSVGCAASRRR